RCFHQKTRESDTPSVCSGGGTHTARSEKTPPAVDPALLRRGAGSRTRKTAHPGNPFAGALLRAVRLLDAERGLGPYHGEPRNRRVAVRHGPRDDPARGPAGPGHRGVRRPDRSTAPVSRIPRGQ